MVTSELSKIQRKILIRASRARVWQAITNVGEFSKWFRVEASGSFHPGARLQMKSTYEGHEGVVIDMVIERMEPERLFSWRWHPGMPEPGIDYNKAPTTLVEFQLEDADGGTLVTVVESGFDQISLARRAKVFEDNSKGWDLQMQSLEQYVSHQA